MRIYTRHGDQGFTDLIGRRVKKNDYRVQAMGSIDDSMSLIGVLHAHVSQTDIKEELEMIMRMLFDINSEIASNGSKKFFQFESLDTIEKLIDHYAKLLPPLTQFILPGGSVDAAIAHRCRTQLRNVEREIITLSEHYPQDEVIHKTLNRISDYFFVLARFINQEAKFEDIKK